MLAIAAPAALYPQCPNGAPPPCTSPRSGPPALVVLPFENRSRDSADTYLAATLTEDVTTALAATHSLRLLGPRAARRGADYVLAGSVRREAGLERVSARLERVGSGEIVWSTTIDRDASPGPSAADQLAQRVLERLGMRASTAGVAGRSAAPSVDPVAFDLYRRGRYFTRRRTQADVAQGLDLLQRAVQRDSTFALAWAEIAITYNYINLWVRSMFPTLPAESILARELDASTRALLADSSRAEIWVARSVTLADIEPNARGAAIRALRRALAIDSLNALAWSTLGTYSEDLGDSAAGRAALQRAIAIEPMNPVWLVNYSLWHFYWIGRYDSARTWTDSALAVDPAYISGRRMSGTTALALGDLAAAQTQFEAASRLGTGTERVWSLAGLAVVAAARGDSARARALSAEVQAMTNPADPGLHNAVFYAWTLVALGRRAEALDWLERYTTPANLHFQRHLRDQPLDPLRGDPRFQALYRPPGGR